ncbi:T9SS type A sorting domain-containing protein, partial [bacterium]|nr:T9SS type A sorting domain-containing protein [bacterium]
KFPLPKKQINGEATLYLENFKDRAFNILNPLNVDVKVDRGSDFVVKIFQNPVDPQSFTFGFKGIDYNGTDDLLLVDSTIPTPLVSFSQAGQQSRVLEVVPLRLAISGTQTFTEGFAGSFRIDLGLIGDVILSIEAIDFRGNKSQEEVFLHVVGTKTRASLSQVSAQNKQENLMYGDRKNSSWDLPQSYSKSLDFIDIPDFPYYYFPSKNGAVSVVGNYPVSDCSGLLFLEKQDMGYTIADQSNLCQKNQLAYSLSSDLVNSLVLVRDTGKPTISLEEGDFIEGVNTVEVFSEDFETGVSSVMLLYAGDEIPLSLSSGVWSASLELPAGNHDLRFVSRDYAKNSVSYAHNIVVQKSFGFERCNIYPNPIYRDGIFDCTLTQNAEKMEWILYDASGDRIWYRSEQDLDQIKEDLDLTNVRGIDLSNGVYFLKVKIRRQNKTFKKIIKFAVIR